MKVIVLSGKRYAGKDVVASMIKKYYPGECLISSIAYGCKAEYAENAGVDLEMLLNDQHFKESHREGIIKIAEERRSKDPLYWVRRCLKCCFGPDVLVITDMRFMAEYDYIRKLFPDAIFYRIEASEDVRAKRGWKYNPTIDQSLGEISFDQITDWDNIIVNNWSLSDLESKIVSLIESINDINGC